MCVGIPMQILSVDGIAATARNDTGEHLIDLSLTGPLPVGQWILTFLGTAREAIDAEEAARITAALAALQQVMQGGDVGDAFDDIEARGPQLPAHLSAAQARGETTG